MSRNASLLIGGVLLGIAAVFVANTGSSSPAAGGGKLDENQIGKAAGTKATSKDGVVRIEWPRTDVAVKVDGMALKPAAGLGSWAAFSATAHGAIVMGDTVVFQDEVTPAMDAAFAGGLEITALHNHFFYDEPKVFFMHIGGTGDARQLAAGVKAVYDRIAQVRAAQSAPTSSFAGDIATPSNITAAPIEQILGSKAQVKDGMVKVSLGRPAKMHGTTVGNEMGVNTWAAFAGDDEHAVVDGDFAMHENELQPVLKAMRGEGINIVAIHQHMTHETPRIMFLHYWGKGKAVDLAKAVKSALNAQQGVKGS